MSQGFNTDNDEVRLMDNVVNPNINDPDEFNINLQQQQHNKQQR
jgi:hypothetical protein